MKVTAFNRGKYYKAIKTLEARKAPSYIIEAYHHGYSDVINLYYREKINTKRGKPSIINESTEKNYLDLVKVDKRRFITEAVSRKDKAFLKAFYQVTNMDILTGNRLPPSAAKLIKQATTKGIGTTNVLKRMR